MKLALGLFCVALIAIFFRYPRRTKPIIVVFRYDDFSTLSPIKLEQNIIAEFRSVGASITFGVIPFVVEGYGRHPSPQNLLALNQDKVMLLKEAVREGIVDLALHGYSHQTHSAADISEFRGREYNEQLARIAKGKQFLEEAIESPIKTFIPPWNTYDLVTLNAAEALGFSVFSANTKGVAAAGNHLQILPATCGFKRLREAIAQARRSSDSQPVIVVLFHPNDFQEVDPQATMTCWDLSKLLEELSSQRDIQLLSLTQASNAINDLSQDRFLRNKKTRALSNLIPMRFLFSHNRIYSGSITVLRELRFRIAIFYIALLCMGLSLLLA